jgi:hypothetical protein
VHGVPLSSASAIITVAVDAARIAAMRRTAMMTTPVAALHQWASRTASHLRIYLRVRTCNRPGLNTASPDEMYSAQTVGAHARGASCV